MNGPNWLAPSVLGAHQVLVGWALWLCSSGLRSASPVTSLYVRGFLMRTAGAGVTPCHADKDYHHCALPQVSTSESIQAGTQAQSHALTVGQQMIQSLAFIASGCLGHISHVSLLLLSLPQPYLLCCCESQATTPSMPLILRAWSACPHYM